MRRVYKRESGEERGLDLPQELRKMKKPTGLWLRCRSEMAFPNKSLLTNTNPSEKNFINYFSLTLKLTSKTSNYFCLTLKLTNKTSDLYELLALSTCLKT